MGWRGPLGKLMLNLFHDYFHENGVTFSKHLITTILIMIESLVS
jgi:hypothetical protein